MFFPPPQDAYPIRRGWGQGLFRFEQVRVDGMDTEVLVSYDGEPLEMSADHRLMRGRRIEIANGLIVEPPTTGRENLGPPVSPGNFVAPDGTVVPQPGPVLSREPRANRARVFATLGDLRLFLQGKLESVNDVSPESRSTP